MTTELPEVGDHYDEFSSDDEEGVRVEFNHDGSWEEHVLMRIWDGTHLRHECYLPGDLVQKILRWERALKEMIQEELQYSINPPVVDNVMDDLREILRKHDIEIP